MRGEALALVGAQYGSEGKGVISYRLREEYNTYVRVGGPNAGHSFRHKGRLWKMQMVPCGWPNKHNTMVLGRGGIFNPIILKREMDEIAKVDKTIWDRVLLDTEAGILDDELHHKKGEGGTEGELHKRIGSTGEGVGAARVARLQRDPRFFQRAKDVAKKYGLERLLTEDTPLVLYKAMEHGDKVLLEGTQGCGLSLLHGPWPYCTSADTNAAQMLVDAGIAPKWLRRVVLVARTYPIRVAGNSGPMLGETSWDELSRKIGMQVLERTTVTGKVRRVGVWDDKLLQQAITLNGPTSIALTFVDYLNKEDSGKTSRSALSLEASSFIQYVEQYFKVPVSMVGTGGDNFEVIPMGRPL